MSNTIDVVPRCPWRLLAGEGLVRAEALTSIDGEVYEVRSPSVWMW